MSCQLMNYCHTRLENVYIQVGLYNIFKLRFIKVYIKWQEVEDSVFM